MKYGRSIKGREERGFTLIELIVVLAILGVLAAITVPLITNFLGDAKKRAYNADLDRFQVAVNGYYGSPDNVRFAARRQYPIYGKTNGGTSNALKTTDAGSSAITGAGTGANSNVKGGTVGGTPWWEDDSSGDGVRDTSGSDTLYYRSASPAPTSEHWNTAQVTRGSVQYEVDSRDYFIEFSTLTAGKWLEELPPSASKDNSSASGTGSYSWYVDSDGKVKSLYYYFPTSDSTGYKDVYP